MQDERNGTFRDQELKLKYIFSIVGLFMITLNLSIIIFGKTFLEYKYPIGYKQFLMIIFSMHYLLLLIFLIFYFIKLYYMLNKYYQYEFQKSKKFMSASFILMTIICLQNLWFSLVYEPHKVQIFKGTLKDKIDECNSSIGKHDNLLKMIKE